MSKSEKLHKFLQRATNGRPYLILVIYQLSERKGAPCALVFCAELFFQKFIVAKF